MADICIAPKPKGGKGPLSKALQMPLNVNTNLLGSSNYWLESWAASQSEKPRVLTGKFKPLKMGEGHQPALSWAARSLCAAPTPVSTPALLWRATAGKPGCDAIGRRPAVTAGG
eukprot:GHVT01092419.1.p2 GENE.GHVT01092419.1~~GHVT01092419.1.p2  ORF type:complete len:114 (+),score=11.46 GHVT01092419.1:566-907(+)